MKIYKNRILFHILIRMLKVINACYPKEVSQKRIDKLIYLRMMSHYDGKGVTYGKNTIFYSVKFSRSSKGDKFIIGNNVCLTGCTLLGHDASPAMFIKDLQVLEDVYRNGSRRSYRREITIGDNVFVGVGAIILPGVIIESNSIVAAGSVVTKNVLSGTIVGGNPAKKIGGIDEFIKFYDSEFKKYPRSF